jgi:hypothetical protein
VGKSKRDGKTQGRARTATFVKGSKHLDLSTLTAMPKSANVVRRVQLNRNAPVVRGAPTVFFKQHTDVQAPSQYAVASTRLARFLKMSDVISHNAFARVGGSEGVVSGAVPGKPLFSVKRETERKPPSGPGISKQDVADWVAGNQLEERNGKYYEVSSYVYEWVNFRHPRIQKGLSDLQLFDAISGQADRHGGNIYIDPVTGQVSGIDDDRAFGVGASVASQATPYGKYVGLPTLVDETTAETILALDPQQLREELLPRVKDQKVLTDKEIDDARRRLEGVQAHLQALKANGQLVKTWDDATYQQAIQNPTGSYLGRSVGDLDYAAQQAANDPTYVVVNAPPTPPSSMPPLPSIPTTTTTTTTTTTQPTQPPPTLQPPRQWQPAQRPQQPPSILPPPPTSLPPPPSTLPPPPTSMPPPTSTLPPPPTTQPPPSTTLGQPTPWHAAVPPSRAAAARQAAQRARAWVSAVPSGLGDSGDQSESDST